MTIDDGARDALVKALGAARVVDDPAVVAALSADSSPRSKKAAVAGRPLATADLVVRAGSTDDVAAVMAWANAHGVPVVARGAGSGVVGSGLPVAGGVVLDLSGLTAIGPVDVENRLVTVGAGVIGGYLEDALRPFGLAVGHYPQSFHLASIGGWIAMRGSGTFSSLYGNIEERVADLEVVLPNGEVWQTRSIPRASEGPDLKQLFVGSEGTLGVITAVTLRLIPIPASRVFNSVHFPNFQGALDTARSLLVAGVRPAVLRIYDPVESSAKHARFADGDGWLMILAFDGDAELTAAQERIAVRLAVAGGGLVLGEQPGIHWEQRRFNWSWFTEAVDASGGVAEAIEIAAPWTDLASLYDEVSAAARTVMPEVMGHVSHIYDQGASLYVICRGWFDDDAAAMAAYDRLWQVVMAVAVDRGVRISHHHGIGRERAPWLARAVGEHGLHVLRAIKGVLDPNGVMNPGKLGS